MTIENPFESFRQKNSIKQNEFTPKISSRIYAFFIDNVCIYQPVSYFVSSPLVAYVGKSSFYDNILSTGFYLQFIILSYIVVALVLSSTFTYFYGATPGQKLFSLKVISQSHKTLSYWESLIRSISFYGQIFIMFLPSFSLLSQPIALHDRVSDTKVVSLEPGDYKALIRPSTIKVLYASLFIFIFSSFLNFVFDLSLKPPMATKLASNSCAPVENLNLHSAVNEWDDSKVPALIYILKKNSRVTDSCFRDYMNEYISLNPKRAEPYFYLWLNEPSSTVKAQYHNKLCQLNMSYCSMILSSVKPNINKHFANLNSFELAKIINYLKESEDFLFWDNIIEVHQKTAALNWFPDLKDKVYYLTTSGIKNTQFNTGVIDFEYIKTKVSEDVIFEANTDACFYDLILGCKTKSSSCRDYKNTVSKKYDLSMYDQVNLGFLSYCDKNFKPQLRVWNKEKYIEIFTNTLDTKKFNTLKKVLDSTYSHPRLRMASIMIMLKEKIPLKNVDTYLSIYMLPNTSSRMPASVKEGGQ